MSKKERVKVQSASLSRVEENADNAQPVPLTPKETADNIMAELAQEFAQEDLKTLPKGGKEFLHADPRAYVRRLDEAVGPINWRADYSPPSVTVSGDFGWKSGKPHAGKVIIGCSVIITGLGTRTDVGEAWLEDDNAATVAAAQAFKRACTGFGLGAYLYKLNKQQNNPKSKSKQPSNKKKLGDRIKDCEIAVLGEADTSQLLKYFFFAVTEPLKVTLDVEKKFSIDLFKAAVKALSSEEKEARISKIEAIVEKYKKNNNLHELIEKIDKAVSEESWG